MLRKRLCFTAAALLSAAQDRVGDDHRADQKILHFQNIRGQADGIIQDRQDQHAEHGAGAGSLAAASST